MGTDPSAVPGAKTEGRADGILHAAAHLPLRDWRQSDKSIGTMSRSLFHQTTLFTHRSWRIANIPTGIPLVYELD